ncbi:MAG: DUF6427 family protein [Daejeonella sp.]|uniref:DUF6427 family protein n=1 Tax=Daejeonella sp. TaxID=2805397 RepID=UPI003C73E200
MIKQFRSINPVNIIFLAGITVLLRAGLFINLPERTSVDFIEPFTRFLLPFPENTLSVSTNIYLAAFLLFVQSLIFNRIINSYNLLGKPTYLPALLYISAGSLFTPFLILSPALFCNFLLLWMIEKFLSIYKRNEVSSVMYDLGMMVALGALIYFPFIAMLPLLWISLLIFRPVYWREWVAVVIGFATIFFFLGVFYYWNDSLDQFYRIWIPLTSKFPTNLRINLYDTLVLIPVVAIMILAFFQLQKNFFRSVVHLRKSFQLLFFMFIIGLISFYLKADLKLYHFLLCAPPAAVLMAYYFIHAGQRWLYESMYAILIAGIIYFQIF